MYLLCIMHIRLNLLSLVLFSFATYVPVICLIRIKNNNGDMVNTAELGACQYYGHI
jgi:hypothetical protein